MKKRSFYSIGSWVAITFVLWVIAWIIAEAIPVFNDLLSLIVSELQCWGSLGLTYYRLLYSPVGSHVSSCN